jgi:hypothetical protein
MITTHTTRRSNQLLRGHFAPIEEPELVARDIAEFFASLVG